MESLSPQFIIMLMRISTKHPLFRPATITHTRLSIYRAGQNMKSISLSLNLGYCHGFVGLVEQYDAVEMLSVLRLVCITVK